MELTQLKYFLTVANSGQISKAAEIMHVSQSAISMAISKLEKELNVPLFEKQGRSIRLSSYGIAFSEMIAPAIAELDFAQKQIMKMGKRIPDTIELSIEMPDFTMTMQRLFMKQHERTKFHPAFDPTEIVIEKLTREQVDFALTFEPVNGPDITNIHMLSERVYVQLRADHPLANRKAINLHELKDTPFAFFPTEYSQRRWSAGFCMLAGFHPTVLSEVCDAHSLVVMTDYYGYAAFVGESTLPMLQRYFNTDTTAGTGNNRLVAIPLSDSFAVRNIYLSCNKNRVLTEDAKAFLSFSLKLKDALDRFGNITEAEEWLNYQKDYSAGTD